MKCAFDRSPYALYWTWGGWWNVSYVFGYTRWLSYNELKNEGYFICALVLCEKMMPAATFQLILFEIDMPPNLFFLGLVTNYPVMCKTIQDHCSHYILSNMNHIYQSLRLSLKISFKSKNKLMEMSADLLATTSTSSLSLAHCATQSQATPVKIVKAVTPPLDESNRFLFKKADEFIADNAGHYIHVCVPQRNSWAFTRYIKTVYGSAVFEMSKFHRYCFSNYFPKSTQSFLFIRIGHSMK